LAADFWAVLTGVTDFEFEADFLAGAAFLATGVVDLDFEAETFFSLVTVGLPFLVGVALDTGVRDLDLVAGIFDFFKNKL
jgi:hypothetical protein